MAKKQTFPFSYTLHDEDGDFCKAGKGRATSQTDAAAIAYLNGRGYLWSTARIEWHSTGSAALKAENRKEAEHVKERGKLPRGSKRASGGGRRAEMQCKAKKRDGKRCINRALVGNYGYCGVHRR